MAQQTSFLSRMSFPNRVTPIRVYIHNAGLKKTFGTLDNAENYVMDQISTEKSELSGLLYLYDFVISALWSNGKDKIMDIFGFSDVKDNWPGNPDVINWLWYNGKNRFIKDARDIATCGDTLIILGKEEEYRRTTESLDSFMRHPLNIGAIKDYVN